MVSRLCARARRAAPGGQRRRGGVFGGSARPDALGGESDDASRGGDMAIHGCGCGFGCGGCGGECGGCGGGGRTGEDVADTGADDTASRPMDCEKVHGSDAALLSLSGRYASGAGAVGPTTTGGGGACWRRWTMPAPV